jgi:AGZA family xanthine/uracil permease-like MFS transporter
MGLRFWHGLERFFGLEAHKTCVRTELLAGLTTFLTMAYILAVNPVILGAAGMDKGAVFTATALSAAFATLVMALWARLPFALAPGMGLNAFFAYTVCLGMGHTWQFALTAVFIEGLIFLLLTAVRVRESIIEGIPHSIKSAISAGIGLFIAFIGLKSAGVIVDHPATLVALGPIGLEGVGAGPLLALLTLLLTGVLMVLRLRGALLIGMLVATLAAFPLGLAEWPAAFDWTPPSLAPVFGAFEWDAVFSRDMALVVVTFLFVDLFDTVGTLIGVSSRAGMLAADGRIPRVKQALFADALGTTVGALLGTSTVTTYVESASGVAAGGRTGLTALATAFCFLAALFLAPLFLMIPSAATAAALVLVGAMMMAPIREIRMDDPAEGIPAFLTIVMMPLTFSIAEGIVFGVTAHVLLRAFSGRWREVRWFSWVLSGLLFLKFWF